MAGYRRAVALATLVFLCVPSTAYAQTTPADQIPAWLELVVSGVGLAVAVILLIGALQVRRLAMGGIVAERISLVILSIACLATAALIEWIVHFLPEELSAAQAQFAAQLLVIVAMALLAEYFYNMYRSMKGYMNALTGSQQLADEVAAPGTLSEEPQPLPTLGDAPAAPAPLPEQPASLDEGSAL